jgi:type IV secretion system protein VirB4
MSRYDSMKALERTKGAMLSSEDKAVSQIVELDFAMDQLASGNFVLGQYHFNMAIFAGSQDELYSNVAQARAQLSGASFVTTKEDVAVPAAFYAQLPCNWRFRPRIANLSSLNFLGLSPLHNFATGKPNFNPWGPSVSILQTLNNQAYHFNFHATKPHEYSLGEKAIANTMVIGKSGTGKTALINFLLAQVQKIEPGTDDLLLRQGPRRRDLHPRLWRALLHAGKRPDPPASTRCSARTPPRTSSSWSNCADPVRQGEVQRLRQDDLIPRRARHPRHAPHLRTMTNLQKSLPNMGENSLFECIVGLVQGRAVRLGVRQPRDNIDFSARPTSSASTTPK